MDKQVMIEDIKYILKYTVCCPWCKGTGQERDGFPCRQCLGAGIFVKRTVKLPR